MKKALLPLAVLIVWVLVFAQPALAGPIGTVDGDANASVFAAAVAASDSRTNGTVSALLVTIGSRSELPVRKAVQDAATAGSMILAFGAEEEQLLSLIPGAGGSSERATSPGEIPVAYYAWQPQGFYTRGILVLPSPLTVESVEQALQTVEETVLADRKAHDEVVARRAPLKTEQQAAQGGGVVALGHGDLVTVTIAHPPVYGSGYAQATPYGKVGRGLMVEMKWNDGSNYLDYWFFTGLDQVVPGIYAYGSDWRSDEYRVKWIPSYSYEDILQSSPATTEPGRSWSVNYGFPFSFSLSGTLQEMRVTRLTQLYYPEFAYFKYDFTAYNATIAKTPYPFDFAWSMANTQNYPFDATSYQTYDLVTSAGAMNTMRFSDWSLHVHKPGY